MNIYVNTRNFCFIKWAVCHWKVWLNWRGQGFICSIGAGETEVKHQSDDPEATGSVSEKISTPEEFLAPLPALDHHCSQGSYVRSSTATQPRCAQGKPGGLSSPPPHKKMPLHLKITFQSPFSSSVVREHPSMGLADGCRSRMVVLGTGGRWRDRDQCGAQPGTWQRAVRVDLQMPELIACCLQLGFIAQLLINCFRI